MTRFSLLIILGVFLLQTCCNGPTHPRIINPREYVWVADTIAYPESFQTTMLDIWGSSPTSVYAVGRNASPGPGTMYRFNGSAWTTTGFHAAEGGPISGALDFHSIHGFGPNDVWAVGSRIYSNPTPPPNFLDSSLIIHYNGSTWTEHNVTEGRLLQAVWGIAPNDVWAGGIEGTMFHYNGTSWTKVPIPNNVWINSIGGLSSNDIYATGYLLFPDNGTYLLHWDGNAWSIQDSFIQQFGVLDKFGCCEVKPIDGELFTAGYGIFRQLSSGWESLFNNPPVAFNDISGQSLTNLLVAGGLGYAYHYNGKDWYLYNQFRDDNVSLQAVWTTDQEAFIVGFVGGGEKSIVWRGKAVVLPWGLSQQNSKG